jgi:hypothetical protein
VRSHEEELNALLATPGKNMEVCTSGPGNHELWSVWCNSTDSVQICKERLKAVMQQNATEVKKEATKGRSRSKKKANPGEGNVYEPDAMVLRLAGKVLAPHRTLLDCGLTSGTTMPLEVLNADTVESTRQQEQKEEADEKDEARVAEKAALRAEVILQKEEADWQVC